MDKEKWYNVLTQMTENKCAYCALIRPLKTHYIQVKDQYGIFYTVNAYCSACYKHFLEGFPWSTSLSSMDYIYCLPKYARYDVVELEYYF